MKIGMIGDAHLGSTDYSVKRRSDFSKAFTNAIELCVKQGAEAVCLLGDVFDSAATRRSVDAFAEILREISPTLLMLKKQGIPLIAIPGNHEYGRGREAGELSVLESLNLMHVLRLTEIKLDNVGICGIPWQEDATRIPNLANTLGRASTAQHKILLLHNFVKGANSIPSQLWQVDSSVSDGFDKVFVGHHHIYEEVGAFIIPGSTEIQNMLDDSPKFVVVYDTESRAAVRYPIPQTHRVILLKYDAAAITGKSIPKKIADDLNCNGDCTGAFIYIRVSGTIKSKDSVSKAEILAVLRERNAFDYYVDLLHSTESKTARESIKGASIDQVLRLEFKGKELDKARRYLQSGSPEELFSSIRERILSDNK
jgi:DNA repair exonuclease SbcCD nuclease subunit